MLGAPILMVTEIILFGIWLFGRKRFDAPQYVDMAFLALAIFASLFFVSISMGFDALKSFLIYSLVVFLCVANGLTTYKRSEKLFLVVIFATSLMVWNGISQMSDPNYVGWSGMDALLRYDHGDEPVVQVRYIGFFNDPNDMGMVLLFSIPLILYFLTQAPGNFKKALWLGVLALHLYGIYLTNSRGTLVALLATGGLYGLYRYGGIKAVIIAAILGPAVLAVMPSRFSVSGDSSSMERISAWHEGMQLFKWKPVLGVGRGRFEEYHNKTAHNSWVLAFSELGLFGYYFWMSILIHSIFQTWWIYLYFNKRVQSNVPLSHVESKERAMAFTLTFAIIGTLLSAFFISRTYMVLIYVMAAISVAQYHRVSDLCDDFRLPKIRGIVFGLCILSIFAVYMIIRLAG